MNSKEFNLNKQLSTSFTKLKTSPSVKDQPGQPFQLPICPSVS